MYVRIKKGAGKDKWYNGLGNRVIKVEAGVFINSEGESCYIVANPADDFPELFNEDEYTAIHVYTDDADELDCLVVDFDSGEMVEMNPASRDNEYLCTYEEAKEYLEDADTDTDECYHIIRIGGMWGVSKKIVREM
jgi:hypothetical protein